MRIVLVLVIDLETECDDENEDEAFDKDIVNEASTRKQGQHFSLRNPAAYPNVNRMSSGVKARGSKNRPDHEIASQ